MKSSASILLALITLLGLGLAAQADPIVSNGGFETPSLSPGADAGFHTGDTFGGWHVDAAAFDAAVLETNYSHSSADWPAAVEGHQFLYLGDSLSVSTISQSVALEAGHHYTLSFWLADFDSHNGAGGQVQADLAGSSSLLGGPVLASTGHAVGFFQFTYDFMAASTQAYTLSLTSFDGHAANLDDVRITDLGSHTVPDTAATIPLLLIALGFVAASRRSIRQLNRQLNR